MTHRTRKALQGRSPVSTTTVHGGCSILFGLPFLLAGCFVTAMALDVIP